MARSWSRFPAAARADWVIWWMEALFSSRATEREL
jgi:hypothetical protein